MPILIWEFGLPGIYKVFTGPITGEHLVGRFLQDLVKRFCKWNIIRALAVTNQEEIIRMKNNLMAIALLALVLSACGAPATPTHEQTISPTAVTMSTNTPTLAVIPQPSYLVFSHLSGDAGNFSLLAGEMITFTWENAPTGADKYEFVLVPLNKEPSIVLGSDFDDSDGVTVSWTIPEHIAAELHATAYFPNERKFELLFAPTIYSGDFPPAGVCSLIAQHQPVDVYRKPDRTAEIFALLYPAVYAHVLEIAPDGWYRIDASIAELYTPSRGILPDTGFRDVAVSLAMNFQLSAASGDGWVNSDKGVLLTGSCPP